MYWVRWFDGGDFHGQAICPDARSVWVLYLALSRLVEGRICPQDAWISVDSGGGNYVDPSRGLIMTTPILRPGKVILKKGTHS